MGHNDETHTSSPSTRWEWRKVMIRRSPERPPAARSPKASTPGLSRRDPREPLTVTLRYRGGPEAWWEVKARGRVWRRPGWLCIHDLMQEINDGTGGKPV